MSFTSLPHNSTDSIGNGTLGYNGEKTETSASREEFRNLRGSSSTVARVPSRPVSYIHMYPPWDWGVRAARFSAAREAETRTLLRHRPLPPLRRALSTGVPASIPMFLFCSCHARKKARAANNVGNWILSTRNLGPAGLRVAAGGLRGGMPRWGPFLALGSDSRMIE